MDRLEDVPVRWSTVVEHSQRALDDASQRLRAALPDGVDDRSDDITLVAEALLENALLHGAPPVHLTLREDARLLAVEVSDGNSRLPRLHLAPVDGYRLRRGLTVIERLADKLDMRLLPNGKVVRAVFERHRPPGSDGETGKD
ncbi:MAG: ATP-binding protein [Actinomycetota bacterium]|nr:ATP-binding protein [Actinomycetota bacterium]